jgi:hypothetical protein
MKMARSHLALLTSSRVRWGQKAIGDASNNACRHCVRRERPGARADGFRFTVEFTLSINARWR